MEENEVVDAEVVKEEKKPNPNLWKKGQSGNPKGRPPRGESFAEFLREGLDDIHPIEEKHAKMQGRKPQTMREVLRDRLFRKILTGDIRAIENVVNRIEGKPRTTVAVDGSVEVNHTGEVENVHSVAVESLMSQIKWLKEKAEERKLLESKQPREST